MLSSSFTTVIKPWKLIGTTSRTRRSDQNVLTLVPPRNQLLFLFIFLPKCYLAKLRSLHDLTNDISPLVSGDIGGNMGLFLGCSLLTLFEFVDLLWNVLDSRTNRSKSIPEEQKDNGSTWNKKRAKKYQQPSEFMEDEHPKNLIIILDFPPWESLRQD